MFIPTDRAIRETSERALANDCQVNRQGHTLSVVMRLPAFWSGYDVWEKYFAAVATVFDSREAARLKMSNLRAKEETRDLLRIQACFRNPHGLHNYTSRTALLLAHSQLALHVEVLGSFDSLANSIILLYVLDLI